MALTLFLNLPLIERLVAPHLFACSVCFVAKDSTLDAYFYSTILLTLIPLGLVGGLVFWIVSRYRKHSVSSDL